MLTKIFFFVLFYHLSSIKLYNRLSKTRENQLTKPSKLHRLKSVKRSTTCNRRNASVKRWWH